MTYTKPVFSQIIAGLNPYNLVLMFTDTERLLIAIGIVGSTVMPHNLYLHSSLCQSRRITELQPQSIAMTTLTETRASTHSMLDHRSTKMTLRFATYDALLALLLAFMVNSTILIVGASAFHYNPLIKDPSAISELQDAYHSLRDYVGYFAATMFAVALFASGQSSTITGTIAGQVIMSGFLRLKLKPVIRRVVTRAFAIVPALVTVAMYGEKGMNRLLVLSQVVLSCQLPFAIVPLIMFVSSRNIMGGAREL